MSEQLSPFSPGNIAVTLSELPEKLHASDVAVAFLETKVAEVKESVELAEINASLNANDDGKNEEKRKLQRAQATAKDAAVIEAKKLLRAAIEELEVEKSQNKQLSREFAGMCHIAELKAAQMLLTSKGVTLK